MAVWEGYLFVGYKVGRADNIFIHAINPDGSPDMTPIWSCIFEEAADGASAGIDYDGTYLWVYPQNDFLYQLDIDWTPGALTQTTWGAIKVEF